MCGRILAYKCLKFRFIWQTLKIWKLNIQLLINCIRWSVKLWLAPSAIIRARIYTSRGSIPDLFFLCPWLTLLPWDHWGHHGTPEQWPSPGPRQTHQTCAVPGGSGGLSPQWSSGSGSASWLECTFPCQKQCITDQSHCYLITRNITFNIDIPVTPDCLIQYLW